MKILWVKSGGLVPLDHGGKIRSFYLLRELARQHEVDVFTFYQAYPNDSHGDLLRYFRQVVCVPLPIAPPKSMADYARYTWNLFSLRPYSMTKYCRPEVARKLREHLRRHSYDVIICDFLLTAAVIPWDLPCPKVLFTHNVEAQIWQRHYQVSRNPIWKAISWREYKTMARVERRYLQRADLVLTVSETDRDFVARFVDPAKMVVVPTGVDVDFFRPQPGSEQPNILVFTGSMDWMPNEDAILYCAERILPLIRQQIPDVTLWVVGRRPTARLQELATREKSIRVTGMVEDIRPYIHQGMVYIVPLRVGGGTRIKVFEAMAAGKAVVSTSVGAEGLPVEHEQNIILADKPEEFASRVITLLRDEALRSRLGQAARRLVEQDYSWASAAHYFAAALDRVVKEDSAGRVGVAQFAGSRKVSCAGAAEEEIT